MLLPLAEFASNNSKLAILGISPYYTLIGYNPFLIVDLTRDELSRREVLVAEEYIKRLYSKCKALKE